METEPERSCPTSPHKSEDSDPFAAFNFGADESVNPLLSPTPSFQTQTMQTPTQTTPGGFVRHPAKDLHHHLHPYRRHCLSRIHNSMTKKTEVSSVCRQPSA